MSQNNKTFGQTLKSFNKNFWIASFMELMERWAWYGIYTLLGLYLVGSTDTGGLGFDHVQKGSIMGGVVGILYFLPLFFGVIADRIGYKISLIISFVIMIAGYYLLGEVTAFSNVYAAFLLVAVGAAFFKPVASAIIASNTDESTGTLGFGIFYMMVNIGGFIGPAMSSGLRTTYGWNIIFIQAAVVIAINLIVVLFFYKESKVEKPKDSIVKAIKDSILGIFEALKDVRLGILLLLMIGFWTMFNQLFNTLPNFIEDWVNSAVLSEWINEHIPFLGTLLTQDGQVKPEWFTNIDSFMIIICQVTISYFVTKMRHINAVIRGAIIASIGVGLTFYTNNPLFTILGTMIFSIGEMMSSPTVSSFISLITPKGKDGLYQGTYFLPVAASYFVTDYISGNLYQSWSDKLSLLKTEMATRNVPMPEVISHEQFIEQGAKTLNMSINAFEKQFNLKAESVDWPTVIQSFKDFAISKSIDISQVHFPFSKNEYFALAEQKLGMSHWEMVDMLWATYNPNKIWYVIVAIGVFSVVTLMIYDRLVIKPIENKK
ncbi:MFS transporter [Myroides odoratus]|uniref:Di-/tripeptide transporter n=1 Tax=Myroides odoratus TaxID=256 RepID=A0A378U3G9_MYROD|nr:MFS transporter [Myroides odoratus]MCS4237380.1 dipeptide/tripeptide permease [Myroides odoratus]MDH6601890.1 POT family proton-dependent oligopeptide transporter [Myroides gitamensis]QQU03082.1 MFS transporter [Myroides odoratus]STZ69676.1 Di-/tripeptide transporter [Myroides odoratus]